VTDRMPLLDRARQRQRARDDAKDADLANRIHLDAVGVVGTVNRILELEDQLTADDLTSLTDYWERNLFEFDYDGLHFIVGTYWVDGDRVLLAVRVGRVRGMPEWPVPDPRSTFNSRWAPKGYRVIRSLASLADALDGES
jgi:hypothetical protein